MAELDELLRRERARSRIVAQTLAGTVPDQADVRSFTRGGAVFWEEEHLLLGYGQHVPTIIDLSLVDCVSALEQLRQVNEDGHDIGRCKFGSIPVRSISGEQVFAITQFCWFMGDKLREFVRSVDEFRDSAAAEGWLLSQHRFAEDMMRRVDEPTVLRLARCAGS